MQGRNVWVIKCTELLRDGSEGWHWRHYLPPTTCDGYAPDAIAADWGGANWIRSAYSKKLLRKSVTCGDIALCYQSDDPEHGRAILGLARFASDGREEEPGSGDYNCFDLCPPNKALSLRPPLNIAELHAAGCRPKCFGPGTQGTIFPVSPVEFRGIIAAIVKSSPNQEKRLRRWLAAEKDRCAREGAAPLASPTSLEAPTGNGKPSQKPVSATPAPLHDEDQESSPLFHADYNDGFQPTDELRRLLSKVYSEKRVLMPCRSVLGIFGYKRLGCRVVETVTCCLKERGVRVSPTLEGQGLDNGIRLERVDNHFEIPNLGGMLCGELCRLAAGRARLRYRDLLLFCGFSRDSEDTREFIKKVLRTAKIEIEPSLGMAAPMDWIFLSARTALDDVDVRQSKSAIRAPRIARTKAAQFADDGLQGKHSGWLSDSQRELTVRFIEGCNSFGILPTGSGKSLCFQLAAECLQDQGLTIVVSPLIALMSDQNKKNPLRTTYLNSTVSEEERRERRKRLWNGEYRLLYVTPEQLGNESLLRLLTEGKRRVIRVAIDEAHCVSEWGQSFRVEYMLLRDAVVRLGSPPVLLLTATAPPQVRKDVVSQLGIALDPRENADLVIDHYRRGELEPGVRKTGSRRGKYGALCRFVDSQGKKSRGIVYTRFATADGCDNCQEIASRLKDKGLGPIAIYHGQLAANAKGEQQARFTEGDARIVVATNAFGLGIDLPKIDWVVHFYMPPSLLDYYQEIGRGGRGMEANHGDRCECMVLYDPDDRELVEGLVIGNVAGAEKIARRFRQLIEGRGGQHGLRGSHEVLYDDRRKVLLLPFRPMTTQYTVRIAHMLALQDIGIVERLPRNLFRGNNVYAQFAVKREELTAADQKKLEKRQDDRRKTLRERLDAMQRFCEAPNNDARWDILDREFSV